MPYGMQGMSSCIRGQQLITLQIGWLAARAAECPGGQYDVRYAGHEQRCPEARSVLICSQIARQPHESLKPSGSGQYAARYAGHEQRCPECGQCRFPDLGSRATADVQAVAICRTAMQGMSSDARRCGHSSQIVGSRKEPSQLNSGRGQHAVRYAGHEQRCPEASALACSRSLGSRKEQGRRSGGGHMPYAGRA
jgi:hypothetical protein